MCGSVWVYHDVWSFPCLLKMKGSWSDEAAPLQDGGVLGMHKHERLLSRTSSGRAPRKKRAANSARGAGAGDSQRSQDAGAASQASTGGRRSPHAADGVLPVQALSK